MKRFAETAEAHAPRWRLVALGDGVRLEVARVGGRWWIRWTHAGTGASGCVPVSARRGRALAKRADAAERVGSLLGLY